MSNSPGVLARLFGRNKHPVVSSLAAAVLNRPLLAHPGLAEALIGGYLSGSITSFDTQLASEIVPLAAPRPEEASAGSIGVISITGGLVNRPMPGPSGGGPISYTAIRESFDEMLTNDDVTNIVFRLETPGGMASGLFDLTDYVFAARGRKPLYALVDDYAYSAAYGLAAACDEIWVSRTGGVGSVGVAGFHEDRSGANEKAGVRVTPIFAGARKIDHNPNFPMSEEAQQRAQANVDTMYDLFTSTVARYRGLDVEAVRATEAGVYHGQEAIDAGLATNLGTWDDLVARLGAPGVDAPDQAGDEGDDVDEAAAATDAAALEAAAAEEAAQLAAVVPPAPALSAEDQLRLARGAIVESIQASGLDAAVTVALLESVQPGEDVAVRLDHARQVIDACTAAGVAVNPSFIRKNTDITQVRSELIEAKAKADEKVELQTTLPDIGSAKPSAENRLDANAIYHKRGN